MSRKTKKTREYRDDYRELKKQVKKHVCRVSRINREHLRKKDCFNKRECANKLYQRRFDKEMTSVKC